jgi:type IV secretory pathway TrbF-like protein
MAAANPLLQFEDQQLQAQNRRLWTLLAVNAGISFILLVAVAVLMLRPRVLPYVVMVDGKGEPVGAAQPMLGTETLNDVVIKWAISEFIRNAKTVSSNLDEEKELLRNAYAFASQQAAKALDDYYHDGEHDPFTIEQKSWVEVRITRAPLRLPAPDTYQVDWTESRHEYGGDLTTTTSWRATLKVQTGAPDNTDARNPLGLYVTTLDWSPEVHQ